MIMQNCGFFMFFLFLRHVGVYDNHPYKPWCSVLVVQFFTISISE